jgi:molecular chaperone DnaK
MAQIGIDFGTTNSLIVAYDKGTNQFYYFNFDEDDGNPIPTSSTVWYYDQNIIVGSEARKNINTYAGIEGHHFEKSIKLKLGQEYGVSVFGKTIQPYNIAADILRHIKSVSEEKENVNPLGVDLNRAIFTVPINFNGIQRKHLRKAAQEAGIEVTTFIHEPFAAIIGYFFTKERAYSSQEVIERLENLDGKFLLTFDWGGGTLDITVVKVENGKMIEIGTAELTGKAGDKFDDDIAKWAWSKFLAKYGSMYNEAFLEQKRKENWDKMLTIAEFCKITLTTQVETPFIVRNIIDDNDIRETIKRSDFEKLIENTMLDACNEIDKAIKEAGIGDINIDQVLLTGGTCYIPAVQEKLKEKFGHKVNTVNNADLLIAQGAAVISEMGWLPFLTKDISIQLSDDSLYPIFEKNTNIAADSEAKKSEDLVCCDNRGGDAKIIIVEGNGQSKDRNLTILKVPVLNDSTFNDDIKLDAIIDRDIILKISARSLMVRGYKQPKEEYSVKRETEVHQLCFGLDFKGGGENE